MESIDFNSGRNIALAGYEFTERRCLMVADIDQFEDCGLETTGTSELQLIRKNSGGQLVVLSIIFVKPMLSPTEKGI